MFRIFMVIDLKCSFYEMDGHNILRKISPEGDGIVLSLGLENRLSKTSGKALNGVTAHKEPAGDKASV
jgi:hypothetical protein